jgi:hypothetical protein
MPDRIQLKRARCAGGQLGALAGGDRAARTIASLLPLLHLT